MPSCAVCNRLVYSGNEVCSTHREMEPCVECSKKISGHMRLIAARAYIASEWGIDPVDVSKREVANFMTHNPVRKHLFSALNSLEKLTEK